MSSQFSAKEIRRHSDCRSHNQLVSIVARFSSFALFALIDMIHVTQHRSKQARTNDNQALKDKCGLFLVFD